MNKSCSEYCSQHYALFFFFFFFAKWPHSGVMGSAPKIWYYMTFLLIPSKRGWPLKIGKKNLKSFEISQRSRIIPIEDLNLIISLLRSGLTQWALIEANQMEDLLVANNTRSLLVIIFSYRFVQRISRKLFNRSLWNF